MKIYRRKPIADLQNETSRSVGEGRSLREVAFTTRKGMPSFVFYEGPPTANGRPGIHHVIARTLKDSVCVVIRPCRALK